MAAGLAFGARAADDYARDASVLPAAAQNALKKNFKSSVSVVKIDKTLGHIDDYEVILTDGTEVKFDNKGNWKEVEVSSRNSVPADFIPEGVRTYIRKNHASARVVGIERTRTGYEVELSDGIDIKFDSQGAFKKYD